MIILICKWNVIYAVCISVHDALCELLSVLQTKKSLVHLLGQHFFEYEAEGHRFNWHAPTEDGKAELGVGN